MMNAKKGKVSVATSNKVSHGALAIAGATCLAALSAPHASAENTEPRSPFAVSSDPDIARSRILDEKQTAIRALESVLEGDPDVKKLLSLHRERAIYGIIVGPRQTVLDRPVPKDLSSSLKNMRDKQRPFLVLASTFEERKLVHIPGVANFHYEYAVSTVFCPHPQGFSTLVYGIRLAHETQHAYELINGIEPLDDKGEYIANEVLKSEVRAHNLEIRLLDRATGGKFTERMRQLARSAARWGGFPRRVPPGVSDPAYFTSVDTLIPSARSDGELNTRQGMYNVARLFIACDELGLGDACKAVAYSAQR